MLPALQTERLLLQPLQLSGAADTQRFFPQWKIVQFLNAVVPWPYPEDGAMLYYRDIALPATALGDEWHWTLRLKHAPVHHIGVICLCQGDMDNRGYWLGLDWHGLGLMTEAVIAGHRLLVQCPRPPAPSRSQSSRQHRLPPHLRKDRYARHRHHRTQLRLRPPAR